MKTLISPGGTIGILGGGQLGRMIALAARPLGYKVHVLDPDPNCSAKPVVENLITASFDDVDAMVRLAKGVDVVTLEIEKIGLAGVTAIENIVPMRPGAAVLETIQDRAVQKRWLVGHGIPVGPYKECSNVMQLATAINDFKSRVFVKAARGGYDGRGQVEVSEPHEAGEAFATLGASVVVAEQELELAKEISVFVARSANGEVQVFPVAENHHENRILAWSVLPARIEDAVADKAKDIARSIADQLRLVGVVAVEMFITKSGDLLVNELAPRPHNSYHQSELACMTSQFEQTVRAVCGLPLGSTMLLRPAAIANILGDAWEKGEPKWERALGIPQVKLALYGKGQAKPGRKMGHFTTTAEDSADAVALAKRALNAIR